MTALNRHRYIYIFVLLIISSLTIVVSSNSQTNDAEALSSQAAEANTLANCRYGATPLLGLENDSPQLDIIPQLGAGWFLTFSPIPPEREIENDSEFVHMVHVTQKKTETGEYLPDYELGLDLDRLEILVKQNPGEKWIIGNEVDRGPNPGEINNGKGDTYPQIYAIAYHDVYQFIKNIDATAQIGNSALVQITPGRLQYLQILWDTYLQTYGVPMPVDFWTMHLYVLPEVHPDGTPNGIANVALGTDPALGKRSSSGDPAQCPDPNVYCLAEHDDMDIFAEQIRDMRQWMKDHGQRNKPLIITEYSILYPEKYPEGDYLLDEYGNSFSPDRISQYLDNTFAYLSTTTDPDLGYAKDGDRLVQQWMWFSVYYNKEGKSSNLVENDLTTLTVVGEAFRDYVAEEETYMNLFADSASSGIFVPTEGENTADANISVTIRNLGNTAVDQPFEVTFYKDGARTQVIDSITVTPPVRGCANSRYIVSIQWPDLGPGAHNYWVTVDSGDDIEEVPPGNGDNKASGTVYVSPYGLFFPMTQSK